MAMYSDDQRAAVVASLAANGGNISKTSAETGIPRITVRKWANDPVISELPQVATIKRRLNESYIAKLKTARERLIDRIIAVADTEKDLFKLSGAFKIVSDSAAEQEVQEALATAIKERATELN